MTTIIFTEESSGPSCSKGGWHYPPDNIINIIIHSKYFPRSWLAKSTRIFHHNQLLMTKFGRILCLTRKWHQKCSLLQVNAALTKKTCGWDWVVFVVKTKMADTSLVSRVRTTAGTRQNNAKKDSENSKKPTRRETSAIWRLLFCGAGQT